MKISTDLGNSLTESQNSPATLGLFYASKFKQGRSISGSAYLSHYSDVTNKVEGTDLSIPLEYGFNLYMNHPLSLSSTFGWGLDFEKMSVFNVDEFVSGLETEKLVSQELLFFTVGYGKIMKLWNRIVFMKMSISQSISNTGDKFTISEKYYLGQKAIIYGQYNIFEALYIHGFYKRHLLSGPNDLTIDRIGVGFGSKF